METVAVVGASRDRRKYGNKAVRGFRHAGYRVVPINPCGEDIEGLRSYSSLRDVPFAIDMASFYVPPAVGVGLVDDVAGLGIPTLWLNPGADGPDVVRRARELGLEPVIGCSMIGIGESPANY